MRGSDGRRAARVPLAAGSPGDRPPGLAEPGEESRVDPQRARTGRSCRHLPTSPETAVRPDRARTADRDVPLLRAVARDPRVAEDEVVLHRVDRVDPTQRFADLLDRVPGAGPSRGQPEVVGDPVHVLVEGNAQLSGRHAPSSTPGRGTGRGPSIERRGSAACTGSPNGRAGSGTARGIPRGARPEVPGARPSRAARRRGGRGPRSSPPADAARRGRPPRGNRGRGSRSVRTRNRYSSWSPRIHRWRNPASRRARSVACGGSTSHADVTARNVRDAARSPRGSPSCSRSRASRPGSPRPLARRASVASGRTEEIGSSANDRSNGNRA